MKFLLGLALLTLTGDAFTFNLNGRASTKMNIYNENAIGQGWRSQTRQNTHLYAEDVKAKATKTADILGIPCEDECGLSEYPNLPDR